MRYCVPELPNKYWVTQFTYKCQSCGFVFASCIPNDDGLVKFQEKNGDEVKWLPMYNKGGYIDLMKRILDYEGPIDMCISDKFIAELQKHIEKSSSGNEFYLSYHRAICPQCNSNRINTMKEIVLANPALQWMRIDRELISSES